jgi:hypothetical protein
MKEAQSGDQACPSGVSQAGFDEDRLTRRFGHDVEELRAV